MNNRLFGLSCALLAVLVFSSSVFAGSFAAHAANSSEFLAGANASFTHHTSGVKYYADSLSDANGFFNITGLPDGNYTLNITALGYYDYVWSYKNPKGFVNNSIPGRTNLYLKSNYSLNLTRLPASTLQGFVSSVGSPVSGAFVELYSLDGGLRANVSSGADGSYSASGLGERDYSVRVVSSGHYLLEQNVSLNVGLANNVNFSLQALPGVLTSLSVSPEVVELQAGESEQFVATAVYSNSSSQVVSPVWSVVGVGSVGAGGVFSSTVVGSATVGCSYGNFSNSSNVTVIPGDVASVSVSPGNSSVVAGGEIDFGAVVSDAFGNVITNETVVWSSSGGVVDIASGVFVSNVSGDFVVFASVGGVSENVSVSVSPASVASVAVSSNASSAVAGEAVDFGASVLDAFGNSITSETVVWSANGGTVDVSSGVFVSNVSGDFVVVGSVGSVSGNASVSVSPASIASVLITQPSSIVAGELVDFDAVAFDAFGNAVVNETVAWSSSGGSINGASGVFVSNVSGNFTVFVSIGSASRNFSVAVSPANVSSVVVSPVSSSVVAGESFDFNASVSDAFGNSITNETVVWSSSGGSVDSGGVFSANIVGAYVVVASVGSVSGNASVAVLASAPASVSVSSNASEVVAGELVDFDAVAFDSFGNVVSGALVAWTASGVFVDGASGVFVSNVSGVFVVVGSVGSVSGNASVSVSPASVAFVVVSPLNASVVAGVEVDFNASVSDAFGNAVTNETVVWSSSGGTINSSGVFVSNVVGDFVVVASVGSVSGNASVAVLASAPASLAVSSNASSVVAGGFVQFGASVFDVYDNVVLGAVVVWSSLGGLIDSNGLFRSTLAGDFAVQADSGNASGNSSVNVFAGEPASIVVSSNASGSLIAGEEIDFDAVVFDSFGNVVGGAVVAWSSSSGAIGSAGVFSSNVSGDFVVVASVGSASANSSVSVIAGAPAFVVVSSNASSSVAGGAVDFDAVVFDVYANLVSGAVVEWSASGGVINSSSGVFSSNVSGDFVVVGFVGSVSGNSSVSVSPATVASIVVSPVSSSVVAGESFDFNASVSDSFGNSITNETVVWSSSGGVVDSSSGIFSSTVIGEFVVVASVGSVSGNGSVAVLASAPASIVVSPSSAQIVAGELVDFDAVAFDSFGNVVSGALVAWTASGGSVNSSGSFSSVDAGDFVVSAAVAGVGNTSVVRVVPSVVASFVISPSSISSTVGDSRQLRVDSFDAFGNFVSVVNASNLSWTVFDGLGFVDDSNVLHTNGAGRSKVTVQSKLNSSLFDEASLSVVVGDSSGSSFSSGGGGGGGGSVPLKSRLGEPCRSFDECSEGQCIDGFCVLPSAAPVELLPATPANASVPLTSVVPAVRFANISVPSSVQAGSDVVLEVFGADGAPLGDASVLVTRPDGGVFTVATLGNGRARFNAVLEGVYSFKVEGFELPSLSSVNVSKFAAPAVALLNESVANATISGADFGSRVAAAASSSVSSIQAFVNSMPSWVLAALVLIVLVAAVVVYTMFFGRDEGEEAGGDAGGADGVSPDLLEREAQGEKELSLDGEEVGVSKPEKLKPVDSAVPVEAGVKPSKRGKGKVVKGEVEGAVVEDAVPQSKGDEFEDLAKTLEMQLERLKKKREQRRQ